MSKTLKVVIGIVVGFVACFIIFAFYNGWFNSVHYKEQTNTEYVLFGEQYDGPIKNKEWRVLFDKMDNIAQSDSALKLAAYYEKEPTKKNDFNVKAFVGVIGNKDISFFKEKGLGVDTVFFRQSIHASKEAHPFFQRLISDIYTYCDKNGKAMDKNQLIEIYHDENFMEVIAPYTAKKDSLMF